MSILGNIYWQLDSIKDKLCAADQALVTPLMDMVRTAYLHELGRFAAEQSELALSTQSEAHRSFDEISGDGLRDEVIDLARSWWHDPGMYNWSRVIRDLGLVFGFDFVDVFEIDRDVVTELRHKFYTGQLTKIDAIKNLYETFPDLGLVEAKIVLDGRGKD